MSHHPTPGPRSVQTRGPGGQEPSAFTIGSCHPSDHTHGAPIANGEFASTVASRAPAEPPPVPDAPAVPPLSSPPVPRAPWRPPASVVFTPAPEELCAATLSAQPPNTNP